MVPVNSIDHDTFTFDEKHNRLVGRKYRDTYEFGDKVRVKVHSADLLLKQLDFRLE